MLRGAVLLGLRAARQAIPRSTHVSAKPLASLSNIKCISLWGMTEVAGQRCSISSSSALGKSDQEFENTQVFYPEPEIEVGEAAPNFTAPAIVNNEISTVSLSDYKGKYVVFFWYPKDFTFVCPTEIIAFSDRAKEFEALNCQLIAASTDTCESHLAWMRTSRKRGGLGYIQIPIIADVTKSLAARYGVLKKDAGIALRGLYIINPEGVVQHITMNDFPIGRSVDETLRTLQAIQFVAEHGEVCPAGWKPGDKTMIADPEKSMDYFSTLDEASDDAQSRLTSVKTKADFDTAVKAGKTLVKFWAPWCGKCKMLAPYVEDLQATYGKDVKFVSLDTSEEQLEEFSAELGVKALPHFRFYKDGKEVLDQISGYKKAPIKESVQKLQDM